MILRPSKDLSVIRSQPYKASGGQKWSLGRIERALEVYEIDLHGFECSMDEGTLVLAIDPVDMETRNRIALRLQKRALPKSDWVFIKTTVQLFGNEKGRLVTLLEFRTRKEKVKL